MYFFTKKSNKTFERFEFWPKCSNEISREREEIVQGSKNFVRPTEIFEISRFEISRVFLPKEVRNVQGTEELVRAIEKFENCSYYKKKFVLQLCLITGNKRGKPKT